MAFDISAPEGGSVFDGNIRELCSFSYLSIHDEVGRWVVQLGWGAVMAECVFRAAYRKVPVHQDDSYLLGMLWDEQVFGDKVLLWVGTCSHNFQCCF